MHSRAVVAGLLLIASAALAGDPGLGDGHWGALNARASSTQINRYARLTADAGPGETSVSVGSGSAGFLLGDLVMVYRATDFAAVDSGTPGPFDVGATAAGSWEFVRVGGVDAGLLHLADALTAGYPARLTQVVLVPEYTSVTVATGSELTAVPWDGAEGGVLAFLSTGPVQNDGLITATGLGFRGGAVTNGACSGAQTLDGLGPPHALKGEGVVADRFGPSFAARGNVANGAGGGNVCNAGGGGGGNGGEGGKGGFSAQSLNDYGGLGGATLSYSGPERLLFGGGGGAGDGNQNEGGAGGAGGGVILIRALELRGSGVIAADGAKGADAGPVLPSDGAGGGGAGGTISVRVANGVECGELRANGGDGGDTPEFQATGGPCGPGGGGGGGRILVQSSQVLTCPLTVRGGLAGIQPDPTWPVWYGATPDAGDKAPHLGVVTLLSPGLDAGAADAGPDAGADGGSDAGLDAGTDAGGGAPDAAACVPQRLDVGCGCGAPGTSLLAIAAMILAVALRRGSR